MSQTSSAKYCPACAEKQISSRLKVFQINLEEAVLLCSREECNIDGESMIFVSRNFEEIKSKARSNKKRSSRASQGSSIAKPVSSVPTSSDIQEDKTVLAKNVSLDLNKLGIGLEFSDDANMCDFFPTEEQNLSSFDFLALNTAPSDNCLTSKSTNDGHNNNEPAESRGEDQTGIAQCITKVPSVDDEFWKDFDFSLNDKTCDLTFSSVLNAMENIDVNSSLGLSNNLVNVPQLQDLFPLCNTQPSNSLAQDCVEATLRNNTTSDTCSLGNLKEMPADHSFLQNSNDSFINNMQGFELQSLSGESVTNFCDKLALGVVPSFTSDVPVNSDVVPNLKLPLWTNKESLCWLDALLCLTVHNKHIQNEIFKQKNPEHCLSKLVVGYRSLVLEVNRSGFEKVPQSVSSALELIREDIFNRLQKKLQCRRNDEEGILFALPVLLADLQCVKSLFEFSSVWQTECGKCGTQSKNVRQKLLPSFSRCPVAFKYPNFCIQETCLKCGKANQFRHFKFKKIADTFALHFVKGLPHSRFREYDFEHEGVKYRVTAVVQYQSKIRHFVTWVRHYSEEKWLCCDDLSSKAIAEFVENPPGISPEEIHIVIWENHSDAGVTHRNLDTHPLKEPLQVHTQSDTTVLCAGENICQLPLAASEQEATNPVVNHAACAKSDYSGNVGAEIGLGKIDSPFNRADIHTYSKSHPRAISQPVLPKTTKVGGRGKKLHWKKKLAEQMRASNSTKVEQNGIDNSNNIFQCLDAVDSGYVSSLDYSDGLIAQPNLFDSCSVIKFDILHVEKGPFEVVNDVHKLTESTVRKYPAKRKCDVPIDRFASHEKRPPNFGVKIPNTKLQTKKCAREAKQVLDKRKTGAKYFRHKMEQQVSPLNSDRSNASDGDASVAPIVVNKGKQNRNKPRPAPPSKKPNAEVPFVQQKPPQSVGVKDALKNLLLDTDMFSSRVS